MDKWKRDIHALRETADKYPPGSYALADHAVQSEWIFLQRVIKDTGQAFVELENFLRETFLPRLFFGISKTLPPVVGYISTFPVK